MGSRGVAAFTPKARRPSRDAMSPLAPRYATFRDVGAVLESTRGVSQAQRDLLQSWSRDQGINAPLSRGMVAASPRHTYGYSPSAGRSVDMRQRKGGVPRIATFSADADDQEVPDRALNIKQLSQIVETSVENSDEDENEKAKESLYGFYHHRQPHHTADTSLVSTTTADDLGMRQLSVYSEKDTSGKAAAELRIGTFSGSEHEMGLLLRQASGESEQAPRTGATTSSQPALAVSWSPRPVARAARAVSSAAQQVLGSLSIDAAGPPEASDGRPGTSSARSGSRLDHTEVEFSIGPTPKARGITAANQSIAAGYTRPHGIPNLELSMADIVPVIDFLDGWLSEMEQNEWTYDYHNPKSAIEKLFFACPFMTHFKGEHMLAVHAALNTLYEAFASTVKDEPDPKRPFHPDEVSEVEWVLRRENLPDWTIVWSFASRARLREMKRSDLNDPHGPDPVYQSTRIKPGAIVYRLPPPNVIAEHVPAAYFRTRQMMFKVDFLKQATDGSGTVMAHLIPFPPPKRVAREPRDLEAGVPAAAAAAAPAQESSVVHTIIPLSELVLLEKNRGKTGALNFFNDYLRAKTLKWRVSLGMRHPVQTFTGIVDARHALVETDVFWNDALPYFAKVEGTGQPGKRFGSLSAHSICITVQYPQFFSNIREDDVLDNSNSTYYNLWQTLRDGAKCICSSGTNAIWDISNPAFEFCTLSRSEDLGTSHEHIPHSAAVYLCVNVALGIAKKTEDFLEALYRWSAGPLELLWPSFLQPHMLKHYVRVAIPTAVFALASFNGNAYWFYIYLGMVVVFLLKTYLDRRKPLRDFTVSTVISINLFIVCSNLMSVMWFVIFPCRIAFYGVLPLGRTDGQGLFWGWISLFISLPTGWMHDSLIRIARHTAPATKDMNYHRALWRGGQLYANSFMFTLLATIAGTFSAYKAWMYDYDLSMWSSFRIADSEFDKLTKGVKDASFFSLAFVQYLWQYSVLYVNSCLAALTMPTTMTKWYVTGTFVFQFVCMAVSTFIVNRDKVLTLCVVLFMCTLNVLMTMEVALLLQPVFKLPIGFPFRAEYLFGAMGFIIVISALINGALDIQTISSRVRIDV